MNESKTDTNNNEEILYHLLLKNSSLAKKEPSEFRTGTESLKHWNKSTTKTTWN